MEKKRLINRMEKVLPWGVLSILIGIVSVALAIYSTYHEKTPSVAYELTSEANILDVYKPVQNLIITFQGENIQESDLNLKIITIRILNDGEIDILKNHYSDDVWGIEVDGGKIIESRIVGSNSEYVSNKLRPEILGQMAIGFNKIIFEKEKYFILELLLLHKKDAELTLKPTGKIAGIDELTFTNIPFKDVKNPFINEVFSGDTLVHLVRFIIYIVLLVVVGIALGFTITGISEYRESKQKRKRRDRILAYFKLGEEGDGKFIALIVKHYEERGMKWLEHIKSIVVDEDELKEKVEKHKYDQAMLEELGLLDKDEKEGGVLLEDRLTKEELIQFHMSLPVDDLIEGNALKIENDESIHVDKKYIEMLERVIDHLKS